MPPYIAAIDQGTTSTRCLVIDSGGRVLATAQAEHRQSYPQPGYVEHDALEILDNTRRLLAEAVANAAIAPAQLAAIGITNQRETLVVWDPATGRPRHPAIVWQDTRTADLCRQLARDGGQDRFRPTTGLPLATYFSGPKLTWLLDHVPGLRDDARAGRLLAGTIDSWLIWNLTGGTHVTDVTNASRTLLMDLRTLDWDPAILDALRIPAAILPRIVPSNAPTPWGHATVDGVRVPVCAALGDQQAALLGQACITPGAVKNTYGTGCFMLLNTGHDIVPSTHGLLTTLARQLHGEPPTYALEGSVAIAGSLVQWLRDNLRLIDSSADIEPLAASVPDSAGIYIVPAFSGLFAPHWRDDARGVIVGLTHYVNRAHIARAALEATAYQTRDILDAMLADAPLALHQLNVDGGMTANSLLMQFQADLLDIPVHRPANPETTALGAAYAAGLAVGIWSGLDDIAALAHAGRTWQPAMPPDRRDTLLAGWQAALQRSFGLAP